MITIQEIEKAVSQLPKPELDRFRSWFDKFYADMWDRQFEKDVQSGKLDHLADQALEDFKESRCLEL
ncbi:MAG: hypothetical protein KAW12_26835 [Candidatus Aminicenantes bacterium]|nr:hypothetical protein [Candidatus Aminicenantes bacterium]